MATATETTRGFAGVRCVHCGDVDTLAVKLDDVSTLVCRECSEDVTIDELLAAVAKVQRLVKWLSTAPAIED